VRAIETEPIPILVWGDSVDDATLEQSRHLANLPFAFDHVALMPDAHVGYGMPIGGVLAADGQVIPHAVGLDIGCGMRAWRTNVTLAEMAPVRDRILNDIQRSVPTGFEWHGRSQAEKTVIFDEMPDIAPLKAERAKAEKQLGSLGGGNHFLELQVDDDDVVWAMVHSGSRNVGKQMGEHYDHVARAENRRSGSPVPLEWGLAHLPIDSEAGREYLAVMHWCMSFADENRRLMADAIAAAIARHFPEARPDSHVAVHHNYAAIEDHLGRSVVVHRKGAVRACGKVIVPGSMGTSSYIGDGLCNPASFESCSHGAGRAMGRKQALRSIPREQVLSELEQHDVHLFKVKKGDVAEEAPQAYKDIDDVMAHQADLVTPAVRLTPVGVVKG
jgi:tRNA-splicing ligase RtcB